MNTTIYEVAKLSKVSTTTVSRILNRVTTVNPQTQKKVKIVIHKLNYKPNIFAQQLAKLKNEPDSLVAGKKNTILITKNSKRKA